MPAPKSTGTTGLQLTIAKNRGDDDEYPACRPIIEAGILRPTKKVPDREAMSSHLTGPRRPVYVRTTYQSRDHRFGPTLKVGRAHTSMQVPRNLEPAKKPSPHALFVLLADLGRALQRLPGVLQPVVVVIQRSVFTVPIV